MEKWDLLTYFIEIKGINFIKIFSSSPVLSGEVLPRNSWRGAV